MSPLSIIFHIKSCLNQERNSALFISENTQNSSKQICLWIVQEMYNVLFHHYYGLRDSFFFGKKQRFEVKNILMMDLFLTITHLFTSHDIN